MHFAFVHAASASDAFSPDSQTSKCWYNLNWMINFVCWCWWPIAMRGVFMLRPLAQVPFLNSFLVENTNFHWSEHIFHSHTHTYCRLECSASHDRFHRWKKIAFGKIFRFSSHPLKILPTQQTDIKLVVGWDFSLRTRESRLWMCTGSRMNYIRIIVRGFSAFQEHISIMKTNFHSLFGRCIFIY